MRICALNHFEAFLECKGMPKLKDLTEVQAVDVNLFREFGSYLVDDLVVSDLFLISMFQRVTFLCEYF